MSTKGLNIPLSNGDKVKFFLRRIRSGIESFTASCNRSLLCIKSSAISKTSGNYPFSHSNITPLPKNTSPPEVGYSSNSRRGGRRVCCSQNKGKRKKRGTRKC
jgi:hypothetical protein